MRHAKHPSGKTVISFDPASHSYTDGDGRRYISVTTFIDQFFNRFDAPTVATRIAAKRGTTPAKLLDDWQKEGDRGRREGTNVHAYADALICGGNSWKPPGSVREALLYKQVTRAVVALLKKLDFVTSETIVFSPRLGIAGTVDLIMRHRGALAGELVIYDWKQNKKIARDNEWNHKARPPINHLDDCDITKYSLQLSLYWKIITEEDYRFGAEAKLRQPFRGALIHLTEDGYRPIKLQYMGDELNKMIEAV